MSKFKFAYLPSNWRNIFTKIFVKSNMSKFSFAYRNLEECIRGLLVLKMNTSVVFTLLVLSATLTQARSPPIGIKANFAFF